MHALRWASHRPRLAADRGFTLLELMITISFIGILFALGLPSFTAWIRNSQVRTVAEALQTGIRTAQSEALRFNASVVLTFTNATPQLNAAASSTGKNWSLQTVPRANTTDEANVAAVPQFLGGGKLSDIASSVVLKNETNSSAALCFSSNGRLIANSSTGCTAAAQTYSVKQSGADRNLNVIVAIGGQIRMCDPKRPALSAASPDGCPP